MIFLVFLNLLDFGLGSAAQGAASRRKAHLQKNWSLRRGIQSLPYFSRAFFLI